MLLQDSVTPTLQPLLGACQCCTTLPCSPEVLIFLDQVQMTQAVILHAGQEGTEPLKTSQDRLPPSSWKQVLSSATVVGDHMHGSGRMSLGMLSSRLLPVTSQPPSQTTPGIPTCCGQAVPETASCYGGMVSMPARLYSMPQLQPRLPLCCLSSTHAHPHDVPFRSSPLGCPSGGGSLGSLPGGHQGPGLPQNPDRGRPAHAVAAPGPGNCAGPVAGLLRGICSRGQVGPCCPAPVIRWSDACVPASCAGA